jgi:hypothetical protein
MPNGQIAADKVNDRDKPVLVSIDVEHREPTDQVGCRLFPDLGRRS